MLTTLPTEILSGISELLAIGEEDVDSSNDTSKSATWVKIRSLASLCRTCKTLRHLVTPLLYRTFVKPDNYIVDSEASKAEGRTIEKEHHLHHLRHFLRTLMERPDLRPFVRRVVVGKYIRGPNRPAQAVSIFLNGAPDDGLRKQYRDAAMQFPMGEIHSSWMGDLGLKSPELGEDMKVPSEDAEVALLLCLTEDVSDLTIFAPLDREGPHYTLAFFRDSQPSLSRLRTLRLLRENPYACNVYNLPLLTDVFRFPALEVLVANGPFARWEGQDIELPDTSIRSLELCRSGLPQPALRLLFQHCPNLVTLTLACDRNAHWRGARWGYGRAGPRYPLVIWDSVVENLHGVATRLRTLKIDLSHGRWNCPGSIGSLQGFASLKFLSINESGLFGPGPAESDTELCQIAQGRFELLPQSLESLEMTCCSTSTSMYLRSIVNTLKVMLPSMWLITCKHHYIQNWSRDHPPRYEFTTSPFPSVSEYQGFLVQLRKDLNSVCVRWEDNLAMLDDDPEPGWME